MGSCSSFAVTSCLGIGHDAPSIGAGLYRKLFRGKPYRAGAGRDWILLHHCRLARRVGGRVLLGSDFLVGVSGWSDAVARWGGLVDGSGLSGGGVLCGGVVRWG